MPSRGVMFCGCSASTRSMLGERQRMMDGDRLKTTMQPAASSQYPLWTAVVIPSAQQSVQSHPWIQTSIQSTTRTVDDHSGTALCYLWPAAYRGQWQQVFAQLD